MRDNPEKKKQAIKGRITSKYVISLLVLSAGTFALRASSNMFYTNLPLVAKELFDFGNTTIGTLSGAVFLAGFISMTFVNARLRSVWRRRLFIASAFIYAAVFSFIPLSGYFGIWFISIAAGFFLQLISVNQTNASGIIGKTTSDRERAITLYTVSLSASLVVGPLVNFAILTHFSIAYSFSVFAVFPIMAAFLALYFPFPKETPETDNTNNLAHPDIVQQSTNSVSLREAWKNKGFQAAVYIYAVYSIPFVAVVSFGGLFSRYYFHATNSSVQLYFAIFFAVSFIFRALMLRSKRVNVRKMTMVSVLVTLLGITLLVLTTNLFLYVIALAVLGIPHGLTFPSSLIVISRNSDESRRNVLNSYFGSFYSVINTVAPFMIGLVADQIGLRYAFGMILISIAAFAYLMFRKRSYI